MWHNCPGRCSRPIGMKKLSYKHRCKQACHAHVLTLFIGHKQRFIHTHVARSPPIGITKLSEVFMNKHLYNTPQRSELFTIYIQTNNAMTKIQLTVQAENKMAGLNKSMSFESILEQLQCVGFPDVIGKGIPEPGSSGLKSMISRAWPGFGDMQSYFVQWWAGGIDGCVERNEFLVIWRCYRVDNDKNLVFCLPEYNF